MKRSNAYVALHFCGKRILAVELLHWRKTFEVTSLLERETDGSLFESLSSLSAGMPTSVDHLSEEIRSILKDGFFSATNISFCLDSRWVLTHTFPIEETLSEAERADQLQWELSNYIERESYDSYVTATARLDDLPEVNAILLLSASARRELISVLRIAAAKLGLSLAVVDVDHFGAEHALRWNHPELDQETAVLLGLKSDSVSMTLFRNGKPVRFRTTDTLNGKTIRGVLDDFLSRNSGRDSPRKKVYVYGENEKLPEFTMQSTADTVSIELLDPMRHLELPRKLRKLDRTTFHCYAPAVGIAMRRG